MLIQRDIKLQIVREKESFYLKPTIKVFGTDGVYEICGVLTDFLFYDCQQTIKLMLSHTNEWKKKSLQKLATVMGELGGF